MRKLYFLLIISVLSFPSLKTYPQVTDYLIELGKQFLEKGDISQAEREFRKVLLIDSSNKEAKKYLEEIRKEKIKRTLDLFSQKRIIKKEKVVEKKRESKKERRVKKEKPSISGWKVKGEYQISVGITDQDVIWKRANWDLNEKDWRLLSSENFNNRENTFDPAIFERIRINLDYNSSGSVSFHTNLTIDPWSFVGKTSKFTVKDDSGIDSAQLQLLYWSGTRRTISQRVITDYGDSFNTGEIKVVDGKTTSYTAETAWDWTHTFTFPSQEIHYLFRGFRELWFDYNQDNFSLRIYPLALENQALNSDDPLRLSNNHIYWEESQWLTRWKPGKEIINPPIEFYSGQFDDDLAWIARDSTGTRLTFLRGINCSFNQPNGFSLQAAFNSPQELWQDYEEFDTFNTAIRLKQRIGEKFILGGLYTSKLGYKKGRLDASNFVWALDSSWQPFESLGVRFEIATSRNCQDKTTNFKRKKRGNAYYLSLLKSSQKEVLGKGYYEINPQDKGVFYKMRLMFAHLDSGFSPGLSTYIETRHDRFWSRHLHFGKPFEYYYAGFYEPTLKWEDIEHQRLGDGIDIGRDVVGLRWEVKRLFENKLDLLFDLRNVHYTNGKYLENVTRLEAEYRPTSRLTTKFLGIYHDKPDTIEGYDPYVFNKDTGEFDVKNDSIEGGKDPSVKTVSLGAEYKFSDRFKIWGIWEHTNDINIAYDNFPRAILDGSCTANEEGYVGWNNWLNRTEFFPTPPYPYYDIFKLGWKWRVSSRLAIDWDWTKNEYKWAGPIDDNINHIGLGINFVPSSKWNFYLKYVYSKWNDISILNEEGRVCYEPHHNFFFEARYILGEGEGIVLQYGELGRRVISEILYDPYGGSLSVLDTQHIVRLFYRRKF